MKCFITSCGRPDLLQKTIESLPNDLDIIVHEDSNPVVLPYDNTIWEIKTLIETRGIGQHASIELFLRGCNEKYVLFCEDDWIFDNSYDWIKKSIEIMENDSQIVKVLCRKDSPHPCIHDQDGFGYIKPWIGPDGINWSGFSWNPGVTRVDILKKFIPFPRWEQELASNIYKNGYKVAELSNKIYTHIGDGRSTH